MRRVAVAIYTLGLITLLGRPAVAAPIQPPVWSGNGTNVGSSWTSSTAQGNGFVTFDSFSYGTNTSIGLATWWGIFLNLDLTDGAPTNTSRWDVMIFDNAGPGGTPQNLIGGQLNDPVQRTAVGTGLFANNVVTVYQFVANIPVFNAVAGTTYWFTPVNVGIGANFAPFFSWIQGTGGDGTAMQAQLQNFVTTQTFVRDGDRAFALTAVPEPATLTLLAIGLGGTAIRRRRRS